MGTNYPHAVARDEEQAHSGGVEGEGLGARVVDKVRQMFCGLHGHDNLLQFEHERMFLRCVSCGHESPGWEIREAPPVVSVREEPRPAMVRAHLVSARRIA